MSPGKCPDDGPRFFRISSFETAGRNVATYMLVLVSRLYNRYYLCPCARHTLMGTSEPEAQVQVFQYRKSSLDLKPCKRDNHWPVSIESQSVHISDIKRPLTGSVPGNKSQVAAEIFRL